MGSIFAEASGPSHSVPALVAAQRTLGADARLWTVERNAEWRRDPSYHRTFPVDASSRLGLNPAQASAALNRALRKIAAPGIVFHSHGLWLMPNVVPARFVRHGGVVFALSPRGMLAPAAMSYSQNKKRVFWRCYQHRALKRAAFLHATAESELDEIRAAGLSNPVAVIRNGVSIPEASTGRSNSPIGQTILSLGRLHPKKNLEALVRAWSRVESDFPTWSLRIVGPDEGGYAGQIGRLVNSLGLRRVRVEAPLYGDAKLAAYREASLFVLPSLNENFAMTVAEALAAGTPAVVTRGAPWAELDAKGCGWWIGGDEDALEGGLRSAMGVPPDELAAMGARGRAWMEKDFGWNAVAQKMVEVYRWSLGQGDRPEWVKLV